MACTEVFSRPPYGNSACLQGHFPAVKSGQPLSLGCQPQEITQGVSPGIRMQRYEKSGLPQRQNRIYKRGDVIMVVEDLIKL